MAPVTTPAATPPKNGPAPQPPRHAFAGLNVAIAVAPTITAATRPFQICLMSSPRTYGLSDPTLSFTLGESPGRRPTLPQTTAAGSGEPSSAQPQPQKQEITITMPISLILFMTPPALSHFVCGTDCASRRSQRGSRSQGKARRTPPQRRPVATTRS